MALATELELPSIDLNDLSLRGERFPLVLPQVSPEPVNLVIIHVDSEDPWNNLSLQAEKMFRRLVHRDLILYDINRILIAIVNGESVGEPKEFYLRAEMLLHVLVGKV